MSVLSHLAVWIVPFELLPHSFWRLYNKPPAFQFCPHIICSALLTQGWSLTEVLLTIYIRILHFRRECVHVSVCVCALTYFEVSTLCRF